MSSEVLAVIPARGGSKRVERKNVRKINDKPLVTYAIEDADGADRVTKSIVSSENEEIRAIAMEYGGNVPFERPAELATDDATMSDVVEHALEWFREHGERFDIVCAISPTAPLREPGDIDGTIELLERTGADSAMSITPYASPPFSAVDVDDAGVMEPYFEETNLWEETQAQKVPTLYHPNGAVFAATIDSFENRATFYTDTTVGYQMPARRSIDIDEPFELEFARNLLEP